MPNRYHSPFPELKVADPGNRPRQRAGSKPSGKVPGDRTAAWPKPGPTWGNAFNRKTKWPIVRASVAKHGGPY